MSVVIGIVLIWRGIWIVLDIIDRVAFGSSHIFTALGGIVAGIIILYVPDRDLKELERL